MTIRDIGQLDIRGRNHGFDIDKDGLFLEQDIRSSSRPKIVTVLVDLTPCESRDTLSSSRGDVLLGV